jgi:LPS-assembly lipoprotein
MRIVLRLFLLSSLLLTACGFRFHGTFALPVWFNKIAVVGLNTHSNLEQTISVMLKDRGIVLLKDINCASFILLLERDKVKQRLVNVSASTTPRQYELSYSVNFSLKNKAGETIMPTNKVIITRQITINNDRILGSNYETVTTLHEMRREAAIQIFNAINLKLKYTNYVY